MINPQFDEADEFSHGIARVKLDRAHGYVGKDGKYAYAPTK
mgnify:FL=1